MSTPPPDLDREQRLDEVIASYLKALRGPGAPARQQLLDSHPDLAGELASFFDDQDRFNRLAAPLRGVVGPAARLGPLGDFGDYEVLEEIARGGMGVVYKARQKRLGRVVALKMLLAGPLASAEDLRRFQAEAEAVACLDHPHIVPIHEVGEHDGHPFLCMKFLDGGSLAGAVGRGPWPARDRESACRAARLVATVADAVHYAHQRGILHRDLKPANVLLDAQGQPHVTDFGLAKRAGAWGRDDILSGSAVHRAPTIPAPLSLTHTGALLGTPAYMAPEQASGERGAVTTAADVYGLGGILYELLAGRPPFGGPSPLDVLRKVIEQEPAPPHALNPRADRDLETVCLKCLDKDPQRRYASAREVAEDLRRYLRGEPILARPTGRLGRTWRWARRQPLLAGLWLALGLALATGFGLVTWQWQRAEEHAQRAEYHRVDAEGQRDQARRQRDAAEKSGDEARKARARAEKSFRLAHGVVNDFLHYFNQELGQTAGVQPLQKQLLEAALRSHKEFVRLRGDDPTLRRELADAYADIARITGAIGSRAESLAAYRRAEAIYRELLRDRPGDPDLQFRVAVAANDIGNRLDKTDEALETFHRARRLYQEFLRARPGDERLRSGLATTLANIGSVCTRTGRLDEARRWLEEARTVQEMLVHDHPDKPSYLGGLASTLRNYAVLRGRLPGGPDEALAAHRRARDLRRQLADRFPRDPHRQADHADSCHALGLALYNAGRRAEAMKPLEQAHRIRQKLADDNPTVSRFLRELASSWTNLGTIHSGQNRKERALQCFQKARALREKLVKTDPRAGHRQDLALCHFHIAVVQGALNHRPEERAAFEQARALQEALVRADPDDFDCRCDLSRTLHGLACNLQATGDLAQTRRVLLRAIEHSRVAHERAPQVAAYRSVLADHYGNLADVERDRGDLPAAVAATLRRRPLVADDPEALYRMACWFAAVAGRVGPGEQCRSYQDLAVDLLRQAASAGFARPDRVARQKAFDPLRPRADFRAALDAMVKTGPRPQPPGNEKVKP